MNWPEISEELLTLERRIDQKLEKLVALNPDTFPIDRLNKGNAGIMQGDPGLNPIGTN